MPRPRVFSTCPVCGKDALVVISTCQRGHCLNRWCECLSCGARPRNVEVGNGAYSYWLGLEKKSGQKPLHQVPEKELLSSQVSTRYDVMADFSKAQAFVAKWEGGFTDNRNDPGGATNYGVSLRWLKQVGPDAGGDIDGDGDVDVADIKALTREGAARLFKEKFWDRYGLDHFSDGLALVLYDAIVNTGPAQGVIFAQRAYNALEPREKALEVDGVIGPKTTAAFDEYGDTPSFLKACIDQRDKFYMNLARSKSGYQVFLKGWLNRTADLRKVLGLK